MPNECYICSNLFKSQVRPGPGAPISILKVENMPGMEMKDMIQGKEEKPKKRKSRKLGSFAC